MKRIAIAGNIAAGKTQVEKYLKQFYPVIDTDEIAHNLLNMLQEEIKLTFNKFDIEENNIISREKLGKIVFSNPEYKKKLENIIHPRIKYEIEKFFEQQKNFPFAFVSIPLIFEAKFENLFDKIIFIYAKDDIRLKRLMNRNNLSEQEALKRIKSQKTQEEKIMKSDFVIKNETSLGNLHEQIKNILNLL